MASFSSLRAEWEGQAWRVALAAHEQPQSREAARGEQWPGCCLLWGEKAPIRQISPLSCRSCLARGKGTVAEQRTSTDPPPPSFVQRSKRSHGGLHFAIHDSPVAPSGRLRLLSPAPPMNGGSLASPEDLVLQLLQLPFASRNVEDKGVLLLFQLRPLPPHHNAQELSLQSLRRPKALLSNEEADFCRVRPLGHVGQYHLCSSPESPQAKIFHTALLLRTFNRRCQGWRRWDRLYAPLNRSGPSTR